MYILLNVSTSYRKKYAVKKQEIDIIVFLKEINCSLLVKNKLTITKMQFFNSFSRTILIERRSLDLFMGKKICESCFINFFKLEIVKLKFKYFLRPNK